ncbi:hypothetical protein [Streptomyces sp. NPDC002187]
MTSRLYVPAFVPLSTAKTVVFDALLTPLDELQKTWKLGPEGKIN